MERSSSVVSRQGWLLSKNRKRCTPPNLPCQVQLRTRKWKGCLLIAGKAQAMAGKVLTIAGNVIHESHMLHSRNGRRWRKKHGQWREKHRRWQESFLTVCTFFQTMSTPLDTSYTFLTVCTWFQTLSTPLDTSYTFLSVCTWFQTMSSPLEMFYTCQNMVQNVYGFPLYDTIFGVIFRPVTNRPHQVGCQTDWFPNQNHSGCHILSRNKQKQLPNCSFCIT